MCAINGFNFEDADLIARMNRVTAHRGPDDTGFFVSEGVSLGHNRLSILDLTPDGHQPMKSADGRYALVFNGEIYNYRELRKELEPFYPFRSSGDTEVLLAACIQWGAEALSRIEGIFAFAFWDARDKKLLLARDRLGVKPLYYFWDGKRLIFSSEIKGILEHPVSRIADLDSFQLYLRLQYTPQPLTLFKDIRKLPAGTHACLDQGNFCIVSYWNGLCDILPSRFVSPNDVRTAIGTAVERQMVSDRPLGIFLSGGLDSNILLSCAVQHNPSIDTFSVAFDLPTEALRKKFNPDVDLARRSSAHFGATHHEYRLSADDIWRELESVIWHMDEPSANATLIATLALSRFAKQTVDVVLGGDGGDELFGGYPRYQLSRRMRYYHYFPSFIRTVLSKKDSRFAKLNTPSGLEQYALFLFEKDPILKRVLSPEAFRPAEDPLAQCAKLYGPLFDRFKSEDLLKRLELAGWMEDSVLRLDKMTMAFGLEGRVPLLDDALIRLSLSVFSSQKVGLLQTKRILRRAFHKQLPDFILKQPKRGWFSPSSTWLRHPAFFAQVREVLSPSYCEATRSLLNWEEISNALSAHRDGEYHRTILWNLLTFQMWAKRFRIRLS